MQARAGHPLLPSGEGRSAFHQAQRSRRKARTSAFASVPLQVHCMVSRVFRSSCLSYPSFSSEKQGRWYHMSLLSPFTKQMFSFLMQRQRLSWKFCNADANSQITVPEAWKGSGLGNQNLQWMEQKLNHRLPWGELTLALPSHSGGLGKETVLARVRACLPCDSTPTFESRDPGRLANRDGPVCSMRGCQSAPGPGFPDPDIPLNQWLPGVLWVGFPS